jgi:hypothetical protein
MRSTVRENNNPYPECEDCKTLKDCPHPDIQDDLLGSKMIPDCCPRPIDIMNATLKKRKHDRPV